MVCEVVSFFTIFISGRVQKYYYQYLTTLRVNEIILQRAFIGLYLKIEFDLEMRSLHMNIFRHAVL